MIIAEIGINHNGDIEIAKKLIDIAYLSGCEAVKFQKRTPDICVPDNHKNIIKKTPWGDMTYLDYKKKIEFSETQIKKLYAHCKNKIKLFASVWDIPSADIMLKYTNIVKIPSAKITDIELLQYCKRYKIRMLSTGMSTETQIKKAYDILKPDILFHCNSSYPAPVNELNLEYILWLKKKYKDCIIGYSGHEYGLTATIAAVVLGAGVVERHITLSRYLWGSDQSSSIEPRGLFELAEKMKEVKKMLRGNEKRKIYNSEKEKLKTLRNI